MNIISYLLIATLGMAAPVANNTTKAGSVHPSYELCEDVPALNQEILTYITSVIGTKVDRGECWDLAAEALNKTGADWNGMYIYGKEVNWKTDCIYPGDIIQFEGVKVQYTIGTQTYTEIMPHHTAIIYEVKEKGVYTIAHQNNAFSGKKVGLSELELSNISKGKFYIYRPVR